MLNNYCLNVIMLVLVATSLTIGTPIPVENPNSSSSDKTNSLFNVPFLEFKNGGVRVNFGGYHAEAGLGGLFGDSRTGGGLYAGAGTPFGAHASAGLGGNVSGKNGGNTGGGLHARAGLGNGGPETSVGLGGNIDGANPSLNEGRIYAARSNGGRTQIISKNIGDDGQSSIQRIPLNKNEKLVIYDDINTELKSQVMKVNDKDASMIRREIATDEKFNAVDPSVVPPVTDATIQIYSTRRCRRKRLCNNTKTTIIQQQRPLSQISDGEYSVQKYIPTYSQSVPQLSVNADGTTYADVAIAPGPAPIPPVSYQNPKSTTFFDDIFNIPIATLRSVNQLLNNKAG